jgi:hypothetical protein
VDDRGRKEMGDKLVMHCRGPKHTTIRYNIYVVNGKLFALKHMMRERGLRTTVCVCRPLMAKCTTGS